MLRLSRYLFLLLPLLAACDDGEPGSHSPLQDPGGVAGGGSSGSSGSSGHAGFVGGSSGAGQGGDAGASGSTIAGSGGDAGAGGDVQGGAGQGGAGQGGAGQGGAGQGGDAGMGGSTTAGAGQGGGGQGGSPIAGAGGDAGAGGATDPCALWPEPAGSLPGQLLPDLALKVLKDGKEEDLQLHSLRSSCDKPGLIVVQIEPAWCGPCGDRADRLSKITGFLGDKARMVSVLYAGPDNAKTQASDVVAWQAKHPSQPGLLARPAGDDATAMVRANSLVPLVLLVDARTLQILGAERSPQDWPFQQAAIKALVEAGGPAIDLKDPTVLVDGRFDEADWQQIKQMVEPFVPLANPSNAHADDPAAAALGEALFFDKDLAGTQGVSCATCHDPAKGFSDDLPVAKGTGVGTMNSPTIVGASMHRWFFWNGRADSLWSQALGPLENPIETAGSRLHVAHRIKDTYAATYESIFGPLPDLQDSTRFPPEGKPGDASYDAMSAADQELITQIFVRVGKAIEAFERTVPAPKTRLDDYVAGNLNAISSIEKDGLEGFLRSGCVACHYGPTLSDGAFHNIWMASAAPTPDPGRFQGLAQFLASPFRKDGPYSDDPLAEVYPATLLPAEEMQGQIRTPPLRNIAASGPWGHSGTFSSLDGVLSHYLTVRILPPPASQITGTLDPAIGTMPGNMEGLAAFLGLLGETKVP